jgi:hypothetical protein
MFKKTILTASIILILSVSLHGQWYVKKYNVTDIGLLSREQLEESLKESKNNILYSGIISVTGAGVYLAGRYLPYEITDESTFFEQLIGGKGMKKILMASGAGIAAGGVIAAFIYLGRTIRIKSVINRFYTFDGSLIISPVFIVNSYNQSCIPGLTVIFNF